MVPGVDNAGYRGLIACLCDFGKSFTRASVIYFRIVFKQRLSQLNFLFELIFLFFLFGLKYQKYFSFKKMGFLVFNLIRSYCVLRLDLIKFWLNLLLLNRLWLIVGEKFLFWFSICWIPTVWTEIVRILFLVNSSRSTEILKIDFNRIWFY